ncbi:MAG: FxsA family protein, partial [marine benthic group bacterium]|nr:FxsA family protein [Gemmatimonadota bacterium]
YRRRIRVVTCGAARGDSGSVFVILPSSRYLRPVLMRLLLLFTLVPLAELTLLLKVGEWLGAWPTVGLVLGTGFLGAILARREGIRAWTAVHEQLARGQVPGRELLDAVLVLLAGVVLITPGILTDLAGFTLMTRPGRNWVAARLRKRLEGTVEATVLGTSGDERPGSSSSNSGSEAAGSGRVIEI